MLQDSGVKLEAAVEAERAIARAMSLQVESLQRQVTDLTSLQAENEALKTFVEVLTQLPRSLAAHACSLPIAR